MSDNAAVSDNVSDKMNDNTAMSDNGEYRRPGGTVMLAKLKQLIQSGEGLTAEFKKCVNDLNNTVFETVSSFSNRYGGYILLGVKDNGEIIGVNPGAAEGMKKNFISMLSNPQKISPPLLLELEEAVIDGKLVLWVYIPPSSQVELCANKIYDCVGDADIDITRSTDLAADLYGRKSAAYTEREIFPYVTENELRLDLIERAKKMATGENRDHPWKDMSPMELMKSAGLYDADWRSGKKGFNLAGILLFGRDEVISSCAPGFETDALVRRDNLDRYDDRLIVGTNLIEAYDRLMEFIAKHTMDRFFLVDNQRVSVRSWIARELVSNILVHREYSKGFPAKIIIERDRIYAENWNRSNRHGRIDPDDFTPEPKNPLIARFFVNIGRADKLGSGVRNLYTYTKIYSGGEPELLEGDVFKTIIPLGGIASEKLPDKVAGKLPNQEKVTGLLPESCRILAEYLPNSIAEKLTSAETVFLNGLLSLFTTSEWITNTEAREASGKSESSVKRFMRNLTEKGALVAKGETRDRRYRLRKN